MNAPFGRLLGRGTAAAALLAAAAACSSDRDALTAPPATESASTALAAEVGSVVVIGDSITVASQEDLEAELSTLDLDAVAIDALDGRRMVVDRGDVTSGLDAVEAITAFGPPDLWVVALGTNDVATYTAEEYAPAISELLAEIPADAPVVWVDTYLDEFQPMSAEFNRTLRTVLAERGNAWVLDWASTAEQDGVLADGIHPSGYGVDQFSRMITTAVDELMA